MAQNTNGTVPRIVVLGAGFGGLYLTLRLAKRLRRAQITADITLIDKNNYFLFSPLLHEVTVEMVEMHHVVHPIRQFLHGLPVRFHEATVHGIDVEKRLAQTSIGAIPYDYLVVALGSVTNFFGMSQVEQRAFPLKTLGEAFRLRNHIITMFERASSTDDPEIRRQLLTFVQTGAGFTGIETITELRDFIHESLLKDYPHLSPADIRLMLVDGLPGLQAPSDKKLAAKTLSLLQTKGIEVRFNTLVKDAGPGWVQLGDGERIPTNTLIWAAGVSANPVATSIPGDKASMRRLCVEPTLQLPGHPEIFALGDCAACNDVNGKPLPTTAQVVNQQAPVAAENLFNLLTGKPLKTFTFRRLGELASLGTYHAVADLGLLKFSGFLAWMIWRGIYLYKMPWWSDKFHIAADWVLGLFLARDTSRIDVGPCPTCPLPKCSGSSREESVQELEQRSNKLGENTPMPE